MIENLQDAVKAVLLDNLPVMVAFQDLDYTIRWANKAYLKSVGRPFEHIIGQKCYRVRGLASPCRGCPCKDAIRTGEPVKALIDSAADLTQGDVRAGRAVSAAPIKNAAGAVIGAVETLVYLDMHAAKLKRQEETTAALMRIFEYAAGHTSQELLREFLDEAETLTKSTQGFFHFVEEDQKTLSLQMWSSNTLKTCTAAGAGTHYSMARAGVWVECARQGAPVIHNDYALLPNKKGYPKGHVPIVRELVVPVARAGKLVAILGVGNKPTDYDDQDVHVVGQLAELAWEAVVRKRAEEENRHLQEQVEQARKMEAIGRLAGGVAHDFNNMLSIIMGHADLVLEVLDDQHPFRRNLMEIRGAAQHSADLTRQLLAFARRQPVTPVVLNLNETVQEMFAVLRRLIGEDIDLAWIPGQNLALVKMDPAQIEQILANLCINARDAIRGVGKITIETQNITFDDAYCLEHPEFRPGHHVMLAVSDNGCGMDKKTLANLFEPFFTTKHPGKGTGLGLATVYGIVRQNGGFINVYSEPGHGTSFKIYLTRCEAAPRFYQVDASVQLSVGGYETILVVEDERVILDLCGTMLTALGYKVLLADSPVKALGLVRDHNGSIDLLITDIVMPVMNGRELAARLKEQHPDLRTLYMSGYTADVIAHHGILQDGIVFLQKPFSKKELAAKVREAIVC